MRKFKVHWIVGGVAIERLRDRAVQYFCDHQALWFKRALSDQVDAQGQDGVCASWFELGASKQFTVRARNEAEALERKRLDRIGRRA